MSNQGKRLTLEQKKKAKDLYMQYESLSSIAKVFGCSKTTIHYWAEKEWKHERLLNETAVFQKLNQSKGAKFANMTSHAVTIMERSLLALAKRADAPTMDEARKASEILGQLDKITRLDKGYPLRS